MQHDIPKGQRGRGSAAVADMKARLAAMQNQGMGITEQIDTLWQRHTEAIVGGGHVYDMAGK